MKMVKLTQKCSSGFRNDPVEAAIYINIDRIVTMSIDLDYDTTCIDLGDSEINGIVEKPEQILDRIKDAEVF